MQTRALVFLALAAAASAFTAPTMGTRMQLRSSKAGTVQFFGAARLFLRALAQIEMTIV